MIIENRKLSGQLKYLPIENIKWDKDIKPYYKKFGELLKLYNYHVAPDDTTIKEFLSSVVRRIGAVHDDWDLMFINDVYYFIIYWQTDLSFSLKHTSIVLKKFKDWWMLVGIAIIDFCTLVCTSYLGFLVAKAFWIIFI